MLSDAEHVLDLADEHLSEIESMYQDSLREQEVPGRLQALVRTFIAENRSAMEYVANAVASKHGKAGRSVYWPNAKTADKFTEAFDKSFPDLKDERPEIAAAWEQVQSYQPGYEWIAVLMELARKNGHHELTPQTRMETVRREAHGAGGSVSWDPGGVTFGAGVEIMGQPVDPRTQRTAATQEVVYVDWLFRQPQVSALAALREIKAGMRPMLQEVCSVAGL
jgi:hypothetical protein